MAVYAVTANHNPEYDDICYTVELQWLENSDGSFTMAASNSFLSPQEKI